MEKQLEQLESLVERVERLEKHNLWYRRGIIGFACLTLCCLTVAAAAPKGKTVEATRFVLINEDGKPRAALENGPSGPRVALLAANGDGRAFLGLNKEDLPTLLLRDKGASKQLILGVAANEEALVFQDRGVNRLVVDTDKDGDPIIVLRDREGRPRTLLSGFSGDAGLIVMGLNQKKRAQLIVDKAGPHLQLFDSNGKAVFTQPVEKDK